MFCNNCGAPLQDGQKFCPNCGSKVEVKEDIFTQSEIPAMPEPDLDAMPEMASEPEEAPNDFVAEVNADKAELKFDDLAAAASAEPRYDSSNVVNPAPGNLNGQDKVTMALICFFLGGIGIHNFMMGETKKGIFKIIMLFCCGISGILALIDFIKILTDSYVVDPDKLI